MIVSVPGASNVFQEGFVAYSNEAKIEHLGVDPVSIERYGAVSSEVCTEMALGARKSAGTDFALSTTGIAGPQGRTASKPVGLCFVGLAAPNGIFCSRLQLHGGRELVRWRTAASALDLMRLCLLGEEERLKPFSVT